MCSVVCLTHNHAEFCETSLVSIFEQEYRNIEIIVVDDGSTDGTKSIVSQTLGKSPFKTQLICQKNTGNVGLNLNRAIERATGEFITILSLDDVLYPNSISSKSPYFKANENMVFVTNSYIEEIDQFGRSIRKLKTIRSDRKSPTNADELLEMEFEGTSTFFLQGTVFRKCYIDEIGGFETGMIGDDLILRTKLFYHMKDRPNLEFLFLDQSGFGYRKHSNNLHLNYWRQVRAVDQWHLRFFSSREMSNSAKLRIRRAQINSIKNGRFDELESAKNISNNVSEIMNELTVVDYSRYYLKYLRTKSQLRFMRLLKWLIGNNPDVR